MRNLKIIHQQMKNLKS